MSAAVDLLSPKRIAVVASNPTTSPVTGLPIGFWWSELTHSYWEFAQRGYDITIYSPEGGRLEGDSWSDPRDESGYSADDLVSLGFISSPGHAGLLENSKPISEIDVDAHDAILFIGGAGPMVTFRDNERVHRLAADFLAAGKVTAVICHATCMLLEARNGDGALLVDGKTWTGFANTEEDYADEYAGERIQPFRIQDEAAKMKGTNFIVAGRFKPHAVRDGNLITGQQQYSARAAAQLVIEALGT
jgi:putative intracellular protease/amidase